MIYSTLCNVKTEDFSFHWKPKGTGFEDYVQKLKLILGMKEWLVTLNILRSCFNNCQIKLFSPSY